MLTRSVVYDSWWLHWVWPSRLLSPRDFPGKNTGVSGRFLPQGIFPTGTEPASPKLPILQVDSFTTEPPGKPPSLHSLTNLTEVELFSGCTEPNQPSSKYLRSWICALKLFPPKWLKSWRNDKKLEESLSPHFSVVHMNLRWLWISAGGGETNQSWGEERRKYCKHGGISPTSRFFFFNVLLNGKDTHIWFKWSFYLI